MLFLICKASIITIFIYQFKNLIAHIYFGISDDNYGKIALFHYIFSFSGYFSFYHLLFLVFAKFLEFRYKISHLS